MRRVPQSRRRHSRIGVNPPRPTSRISARARGAPQPPRR
jgi:hypothetical protein